MTYLQDYAREINEFKNLSLYYFHFQFETNIFGKSTIPLVPPAMDEIALQLFKKDGFSLK